MSLADRMHVKYEGTVTGRYAYTPPRFPVTYELEHIGACVQEDVPVSAADLALLLLWVVSVELKTERNFVCVN